MTNTKRVELDPFAPPSDLRSFCVFHGAQPRGHCVECDADQGIDRVALAHSLERDALLLRLRELGFNPPPAPSEELPAPNQAVTKMSVAQQREELLKQLESLPAE